MPQKEQRRTRPAASPLPPRASVTPSFRNRSAPQSNSTNSKRPLRRSRRRPNHLHRLRRHFLPNPVPRDHRNTRSFPAPSQRHLATRISRFRRHAKNMASLALSILPLQAHLSPARLGETRQTNTPHKSGQRDGTPGSGSVFGCRVNQAYPATPGHANR